MLLINSTFLIFIKHLIAFGFTRQALRAFDDAHCFLENHRFGVVEFGFLLDKLCKYGYTKIVIGVLNEKKQEFGFDEKIYTILISGLCKLKRIDIGDIFLKEMIELGIEPNVVTFNVLLNGICRTASLHPEERFERNVRNAKKVFDEMRRRGIEPDVTSFSIVLHMYSRAHKSELTLEKLKLMKAKGISPMIETYTSVIKCLCSYALFQMQLAIRNLSDIKTDNHLFFLCFRLRTCLTHLPFPHILHGNCHE